MGFTFDEVAPTARQLHLPGYTGKSYLTWLNRVDWQPPPRIAIVADDVVFRGRITGYPVVDDLVVATICDALEVIIEKGRLPKWWRVRDDFYRNVESNIYATIAPPSYQIRATAYEILGELNKSVDLSWPEESAETLRFLWCILAPLAR